MSAKEIGHFNRRALYMSGGIDIFGLPDSLPRKEISDKIVEDARLTFFSGIDDNIALLTTNSSAKQELEDMPEYPEYYDRDNILTERFYHTLMNKLNVRMLPDKVMTRYAVTVQRTDVFTWPEDRLVMNKPYDYELNRNQISALNPGTPVAVLHSSKDCRWVFIRTAYFDGWVKKEDAALTTRENAAAYPGPLFLTVTAPSVRTASGVELPLGTQVLLTRALPEGYEVKIPGRKGNGDLMLSTDFLNSDGVREGFVPYTRRNVITQAFKLLDRPFGWGKSRSGWDCSSFIQDTFSVFGIQLPRNSNWQVKVGEEVAVFDDGIIEAGKADTIFRSKPAVTLLMIPGHIMLYLGEDKGKLYAIHALLGVRDSNNNRINVNKVAVTGLDLGGKDRSLLDRVVQAGGVYLEPSDFKGFSMNFLKWFFSHRFFVMMGLILLMLIILEYTFILLAIRLSKKRGGNG